jgi:hypothetical protein
MDGVDVDGSSRGNQRVVTHGTAQTSTGQAVKHNACTDSGEEA